VAASPAPNMMTARTIVTLALRDSGYLALGQQAPAQIVNEAFIRLNWIIKQWNALRWMSWHLLDLSCESSGQEYFTIGPSGDFDPGATFSSDYNNDYDGQSGQTSFGMRPLKLEKAYARMTNSPGIPTDYSLRLIPSYEDYSKIVLKTMTNFPTHFFYDPALPLGKIYFWPIPQNQLYEMHVLIRQPLLTFPSLDSQLLIPGEYEPALELTLAVWLRRAAKMPPDPELAQLWKNAMNIIRVNNTELQALDMPAALTRPSIYNILADEWH
jgi:hypothetical protein